MNHYCNYNQLIQTRKNISMLIDLYITNLLKYNVLFFKVGRPYFELPSMFNTEDELAFEILIQIKG